VESGSSELVFGPIASRRFGRSLGVNNIPAKHCSYSCVYCQVGATPHTEVGRRAFFEPGEVAAAVERKVAACRAAGESIDVISFVPAGEPTLDIHLGEEIAAVKHLGLPIAVITNGSLLWMEDVRRDLLAADIVSVEIDTVDETVWRRLDRPCPTLTLAGVQNGIREFVRDYRGELVMQTMLIGGVNDDVEALDRVAAFIAELSPRRVCLSVPTRPPADARVEAPDEAAVVRAYATFAARIPQVELLTAVAHDVFVKTGDAITDLVSAVSVHPMRQDDLVRGGVPLALIDEIVAAGRVARVEHSGKIFLARMTRECGHPVHFRSGIPPDR
jgi:wyosine [tRNA(Phe)-imidazoG37] synthetase (radical SAM superfamily)